MIWTWCWSQEILYVRKILIVYKKIGNIFNNIQTNLLINVHIYSMRDERIYSMHSFGIVQAYPQ